MIRQLLFSLAISATVASAQDKAAVPETSTLPPMKKTMEQATVHARQATEAMRRADWKQARDQWQLLLKIQPESAAALANLGSVEVRLKDLASAQKHLEEAVRIKPGLASAWHTLGVLQSDAGRPMLALSSLTRAVYEDPMDPRLHNALAIELKKMGWVKGAELEFQKTLDLDPVNADAHFNLSLLFMDQKPPAEESARRHYLRARGLGAEPDAQLEKLFMPTPPPAPDAAPAAKEKEKETVKEKEKEKEKPKAK